MSLNIIIKGGHKGMSADELNDYMARKNEAEARREKADYARRSREIAKQNQHRKGEKSKHFKPVGAIDARTFFRWQQEDKHFWDDKKNRDKFYKDNPECKIQDD